EDSETKKNINIAMRACATYSTSNQWRRGEGLILCGSVGVGKTRSAICILKTIIDSNFGVKGIFMKIDNLADRIIREDNQRGYIESLLKYDIVVIDDMDRIPTDKEWMRGQVFGLYDKLIQKNIPIIGTTNLSGIKQLKEKFEPAIISRLIGACNLINFGGDQNNDYRILRKVYGQS
ncbi:MAG TPA: ATP-binding protein, partial [Candidatus Nitrosocosmicus sp.]|nr:ATP-binding protein [Candidatus Nitrosocosmicus sp.]